MDAEQNKPDYKVAEDSDCLDLQDLMNYAGGKATRVPLSAIEEHLAKCDMCTDAVDGLRMHPNPAAFESEVQNLNTQIRANTTSSGSNKVYYRAAAIIVLLISASLLWMRPGEPDRLFDSYFTPAAASIPVTRGALAADTLERAFQLYERKSYEAADDEFQKYLSAHPDNIDALFYSAISTLAIGESEEAIERLQTVESQDDTLYTARARWYRALALVKNGNYEAASSILSGIANASGPRQAKAQDLLREITGE